jgi:cytochrome c biogenesis protein CcmG/thiol:disulfide interchange protein DsbE
VRLFNTIRNEILAAGVALILASPLPAHAILGKGEAAPPIKVVTTAAQNVTLANYKGHVLVMDFFATWCGPCRKSIPHLIALNGKYNKQGLQILGMSADDEGDKDAVKEFLADKKINYPVAMANEDLLADYGVRSLPTLFVINKKGMVVEKYQGFNDEIAGSMETLIKKLLAE